MKKHKGLKIFLILVLVIVLGAAGAGVFTANHYLSKINRVDDAVETVPAAQENFETEENRGLEIKDSNDVVWDPLSGDFDHLSDEEFKQQYGKNATRGNNADGSLPVVDDHLLNILLVGQDRLPGEGRKRSDSMILCSVNLETKKVSMISFLRDLYVQIPGYTDNRLNATYEFGGFPLLTETLYKNFGVTVDGCFEVDFNGFKALVDQVGGVDIRMDEEEAAWIGIGDKEDVYHLDGTKALAYARIRRIDSDFYRTGRQRTVLLAIYEKIKSKSITELLQMLDAALPYLTTNMSNTDIYATAMKVFPLITSVDISTYYIPPDDMYYPAYIREMCVLVPDLRAVRNILRTAYLPL